MMAGMKPSDSFITAYRCHGWAYMHGYSVKEILGELFGAFCVSCDVLVAFVLVLVVVLVLVLVLVLSSSPFFPSPSSFSPSSSSCCARVHCALFVIGAGDRQLRWWFQRPRWLHASVRREVLRRQRHCRRSGLSQRQQLMKTPSPVHAPAPPLFFSPTSPHPSSFSFSSWLAVGRLACAACDRSLLVLALALRTST